MEKVTIKRSTLISIMKESKKCDSLNNAYFKQSQAFDLLVDSNNIMFQNFEQTRSEKIELQKQLDTKEQKLKKILQKPNTGWIVPALLALTGGLILGITL